MRVALANDRQLKNFIVTDQLLDSVLLAEFEISGDREGFRQTKTGRPRTSSDAEYSTVVLANIK